jgi:hypothetical protein
MQKTSLKTDKNNVSIAERQQRKPYVAITRNAVSEK